MTDEERGKVTVGIVFLSNRQKKENGASAECSHSGNYVGHAGTGKGKFVL